MPCPSYLGGIMRALVRVGRTVAVTAAFCLLGAGSASAFGWGTLTVSHGGYEQGKGFGSFYGSGYSGGTLVSTLADLRKDGTRTYAEGNGYGNNDYLRVQSGRRSDGGNTLVRMSDQTGYAAGSTSGFTGYVKVCQDVSAAPDWCTHESSGPF